MPFSHKQFQHRTYPLIGINDPPPYQILNPQGKADVLLVGDHVSNNIPEGMNNLGLDTVILEQHVAYDIGTRKLITSL